MKREQSQGAEEATETTREPETSTAQESIDPAIERVLQRVDLPAASGERESRLDPSVALPNAGLPSAGLRTARLSRIDAGRVFVRLRGHVEEVEVDVDDEVDIELLRQALEGRQAVLVESDPDGLPVIVGMLQTKVPDTLELRARKIIIEGEEEVLLRSGTAAMRLRQDGDVEMVGSRITTMSRGLFRLVGRMLRLN